MAINKIIYGGETLIDLTADTVTADKVLKNYTFHGKDGQAATGSCTYDSDTSDANLLVSEALNEKVFYANGARKVGTMPNNGKVTKSISSKTESYTIPIGYHDGSGTVAISSVEQAKIISGNIKNGVSILGVTGNYTGEATQKPQSKTVNAPLTEDLTVSPDSGYTCLSQVVVRKVSYVASSNSYGTTITIG